MMQNEEAKQQYTSEPYNPWTSTDEKPMKSKKQVTNNMDDPLDENV